MTKAIKTALWPRPDTGSGPSWKPAGRSIVITKLRDGSAESRKKELAENHVQERALGAAPGTQNKPEADL